MLINAIALDINECREGLDECAENCINTVGSYTCSCNSGYRLDSNGLNCNGKTVEKYIFPNISDLLVC